MIDDALERYPVMQVLDDGTACTIRPLERNDEESFVSFLKVVPEVERLFIKPRIGSGRFRKQWFRDLDYDDSLTLIAIAHHHIIGMTTLQQRQGGWKRHIGRVHSLTHPEYRDVGVSGMLIHEIIEVAQHSGLTQLEAEFNGERAASILCFEQAGFHEMLRIPHYLRDMSGGTHQWVLLGMRIRPSAEDVSAGD
jgi:ribosomal protein S18 acetylase RimI-like enzyme